MKNNPMEDSGEEGKWEYYVTGTPVSLEETNRDSLRE